MEGRLFYLITCNDEIQTFPIPIASLGTGLWFPFGRGVGKRQSRWHLVMSGWREYLQHSVASTQVLADTLHRAAATWAPKRITALTGIVNGPTRSNRNFTRTALDKFNQIHAHSMYSVDDQSIGHGFQSCVSNRWFHQFLLRFQGVGTNPLLLYRILSQVRGVRRLSATDDPNGSTSLTSLEAGKEWQQFCCWSWKTAGSYT